MIRNALDRLADAIAERFPLLSQMVRDGSILVVTPAGAQTSGQVLLRTVIQFDGDVVISRRAGLRDSLADAAHLQATKATVNALARELGRFRLSGQAIDGARIAFILGAPPAASLLGAIPAVPLAGLGTLDGLAIALDAAHPMLLYFLPEAIRGFLRLVGHWLVRRKLRQFGMPV